MSLRDVRFTLRSLARRPLYAAISVFVLALAIGANVTVFSVFNGLFLRSLPYPDDDRLVTIYNTYPGLGLEYAGTSIPDYFDRREHAPSLEDIAIYTSMNAPRTLGDGATPVRANVIRTSPSFFSVLGVAPRLGRTFTAADAEVGNDTSVILSHRLWNTQFGADPDIVGRDIQLDGQPFTVVGVMPRSFTFPTARIDAWIPFAITPEQASDQARGTEFSSSVGRMRPGATVEGLNAEFDTIVQRVAERLDVTDTVQALGFTGKARQLREDRVGDLRELMLVLQACVLAVLLIACANVANLQLARIAARRKELSVRTALGAHRRQLASLVLGEAVVVAGAGAMLGLMAAHGGLELVRSLGLDRADQGFVFALDLRVLAFTIGAAFIAAIASSALPLIALYRENPAQVVQEAGRLDGGGRAARRFRSGLVTVQVAISVALLVSAGLLAKNFYQLQRVDPGFDARNVTTAAVALPERRFGAVEAAAFHERVLERLRAQPGVTNVAYASVVPFTGQESAGTLDIDGFTPADGESAPHANIRIVSEQYHEALRVPVIRGRSFIERESEPVVVIDDNMARRYWPGGDAIGQRLRPQWVGGDWFTIIGVVPALKQQSLTETPSKETIYLHYRQSPTPTNWGAYVLRTEIEPASIILPVRDAVSALDPDVPLFDVMRLQDRIDASLGPQRAPMVLTVVFAGIAFALAVIGVYGVLTWAVAQRFGEIGVRMALGARRDDILRLVIGQGVRPVALGLVIGVGAALGLGRLVATQITDVSVFDPGIFGAVIGGLAAAALIASFIPAYRASRIDPVRALGYQ